MLCRDRVVRGLVCLQVHWRLLLPWWDSRGVRRDILKIKGSVWTSEAVCVRSVDIKDWQMPRVVRLWRVGQWSCDLPNGMETRTDQGFLGALWSPSQD